MAIIFYLLRAEKTARKKLREYEEATEDQFHHWTDSALTSMGLMAVMGVEFMICVLVDACIITGILVALS